MTQPSDSRLPLVDLSVLKDLELQLQDAAPARTFARDYVESWPGRYGKLAAAVAAQSPAGTLDAVLSIKNASAMLGAARLAQLARDLEALVRAWDMAAVAAALPGIESCGRETVEYLRTGYLAGS